MTYPLNFTWSQMLTAILIALLVGAFFGTKIKAHFDWMKEQRENAERAALGRAVLRTKAL